MMAGMSTQAQPGRRGRAFDSLQQEVFLNLWRTYDRLRMLEEELFSAHGLTPQQYNALRLLRGEHPAAVPTLVLAGRLVSRAPDITRLLDKLEQAGWISRQRRSDNRRVVDVGITEAGMDLLGQIERPLRACHERQLGHLSPEQCHQLIALLQSARRPHEDPEGPWA
jgi:DNA-binding MarR family transcriptional regulator